MKQTLLSFVFAISTFTFGQYEKGNTVVVWTKLKYKESLEGVEGVSPDHWRKSFNEIYQKTNKADNLLKSSLVLSHYWTGASWEYHEVKEYRSIADADKSQAEAGARNRKIWPDEEERRSAWQAVNKYRERGYHGDSHVWENHVRYMKKRKNTSDTPARTVTTVVTRYWKPLGTVEDGSAEERQKMMDKYHRQVTMQNDKVLSQRMVTHYWSGEMKNGEWPVTFITEFATMADADDAETEAKLFEKAFKEKDAQKYSKYWFGKHEDIGVFYNETSFSKN